MFGLFLIFGFHCSIWRGTAHRGSWPRLHNLAQRVARLMYFLILSSICSYLQGQLSRSTQPCNCLLPGTRLEETGLFSACYKVYCLLEKHWAFCPRFLSLNKTLCRCHLGQLCNPGRIWGNMLMFMLLVVMWAITCFSLTQEIHVFCRYLGNSNGPC